MPVALTTAVAVILGIAKVYSGTAAAQRLAVGVGNLKGRVGVTKSNGEVVPPVSATVFVLFSLEQRDLMERSVGQESFLLLYNVDTAGGQFRYQLNNLLAKNKDLKRLEKSVRHNPRPEDANQIAAYYLQSVDEALTRVRSWLTKRTDRSWQMRTIAPDVQGFWSAEGLQTGEYEVVARGTLSGYDVDWAGEVDLPPGGTVTLPLTRPRFFHHK